MLISLATIAGPGFVLLGGLAAGAGHALSGPDHLAAVVPIAAHAPSQSWRVGLSWGLGHGAGVFVLGLLAIGARSVVDLHLLSHHAELLVGLALVLTGAWSLWRAGHPQVHTSLLGTSLGVGTLHGLAGGAHLVVLFGAMALPPAGALGWLLAFLAGATVSMSGVATATGWLGTRLPDRGLARLQTLAGLGAVVVGVLWTIASL